MRSLLGTWRQRLRRRWRLVIALALLGGVAAALAGPHLLAWYHWHRAQQELERYHGAAALEHLRACLRIWPDSARAHFLASRAARRAGDFEAADEQLRACERLGPDPAADTNLEWALLRAALGDLSRPVEDYLLSRASQEPDVTPLVWEALAEGYGRMYRVFEALACLDRWLRREPDNVRALVLRGNVWRQVQQLAKALPDYRRAVELDPEQDEARRWLALGLLEGGRYEEALTHVEWLSRQRPADANVRVLAARCRAGLGQVEQARKLLDAVLAEGAGGGMALRARGEVELKAGLAGRAERWLRQAARAQPFDYQTQWWLYQAFRQQGKEQEAASQKALVEGLKNRLEQLGEITSSTMSLRPHDPAVHCRLGTLLLGLGYEQLGERWLHAALQQDPGYRPAHAALAAFYQAPGDSEKAADHRRQAAEDRGK